MQRILSEVTHHMEQQYVAHRNLDKLRLENEGLSLRQKDRKVCCLFTFLLRMYVHTYLLVYDQRTYILLLLFV